MNLIYVAYKYGPSFLRNKLLSKIVQKEGGQMFSSTLRKHFKENYKIEVGYGSYGGCFNKTNINDSVVFGNYCSIAPTIRIFRANHPVNSFTTHPILYNPIVGYVSKDKLHRPNLTVGHDVWIGEWAIILPNVKKIGNGAVIGAGSIVTKDVEPYSINVGNPAKKIAMRFNENQIKAIETSRWWELPKNELIKEIEPLNKLISKHE